MEEEFLDDVSQGTGNSSSQGSADSWGDEHFATGEETGGTSFSAAVQAVFPNGIANVRNGKQGGQAPSQPAGNMITPHEA